MASWIILLCIGNKEITPRIFGLLIETISMAFLAITTILIKEYPANLIFSLLFLIEGALLYLSINQYKKTKEFDPEMYEWEYEGNRDHMGRDENHEQYQQDLVESLAGLHIEDQNSFEKNHVEPHTLPHNQENNDDVQDTLKDSFKNGKE